MLQDDTTGESPEKSCTRKACICWMCILLTVVGTTVTLGLVLWTWTNLPTWLNVPILLLPTLIASVALCNWSGHCTFHECYEQCCKKKPGGGERNLAAERGLQNYGIGRPLGAGGKFTPNECGVVLVI